MQNTFILKRRYDPLLHKIGAAPRKLRKRHMIYDLVENTDIRKKVNIQLVLLDYVEGKKKLQTFGASNIGQLVLT